MVPRTPSSGASRRRRRCEGEPMAPSTVTGARRGRRGTLSRGQILAAALRIADSHGPEALTMRRVATERGVAEKLWDEVPLPARHHGDWKEPLRAFAFGLRALITNHPRTAALLLTRHGLVRRPLEAYDILLSNIRDAGYDDDRAVQILTAALTAACTDAFTALAYRCITGASGTPSGPDALIALSQLLPPGTPPHLVRTAYAICTCEPGTNFTFLLDLILAGANELTRSEQP